MRPRRVRRIGKMRRGGARCAMKGMLDDNGNAGVASSHWVDELYDISYGLLCIIMNMNKS